MPLIVQKYGGSSLSSPRHIQSVAKRIAEVRKTGTDVVVVVSAMGRMTDHLIRLAYRTVKRPAERELDMLMTAGERVSMALLAMGLSELGVSAISFTGSQSGIVTTPDHTNARILEIRSIRIREELKKGKVVIIAGFQGVSTSREITTLGRGGSDTTAVALAAELGADVCEILTDVDGLFTADPRVVPNARLIGRISYDLALEMASLGAKLQARSIEVARRHRVKLSIRSSYNWDCPGTELVFENEVSMEKTIVQGVTTQRDFHFFEVSGRLDEISEWFEKQKTAVRFVTYSNGKVQFLVMKDVAPCVDRDIAALGVGYQSLGSVALVSVVANGLSHSPEILRLVLAIVRSHGGECLMVLSNALSITIAIAEKHMDTLAQALHDALVARHYE